MLGRAARGLTPRLGTALRARGGGTAAAVSDEPFDLVVVGGGVMGAWTAVCAAKRGAKVCLADQYMPAHEHGSSHGDGRIYRLAYSEDVYVDMMLHSLPLWKELQTFAAEPLMHQTGGLNMAPNGGGRLEAQGELYARRGIEHEWLTAAEVNERFPQFGLTPDLHGLYQPDYGVLFASKCVDAAWRYASSLGAETRTPFRASAVRVVDGVTIVDGADGSSLRAKTLVLALGAWMSPLVDELLGVRIPSTVTAETVAFYKPKADGPPIDHSYKSMPVFVPETDNGLGPFGYYGLPMIDIGGIKASAHYAGPIVHPDKRPKAAGGLVERPAEEEAAAEAQVDAVLASTSKYISETFPHVEHEPFLTQSCLYTSTVDHDYVISRVPGHPSVIVLGGGSGHAFKMGPAIGDAAVSLAFGEEPPFDVERFDVARLIQLEKEGGELDHNKVAPPRR